MSVWIMRFFWVFSGCLCTGHAQEASLAAMENMKGSFEERAALIEKEYGDQAAKVHAAYHRMLEQFRDRMQQSGQLQPVLKINEEITPYPPGQQVHKIIEISKLSHKTAF